MQPIRANFLVTKQDFYEWKRASCQAALRRWEVVLCRVLGVCLAGFGILGICFFPGAFVKAGCGLITAGSIVVGLYYDTLYPYLVHRRITQLSETLRPQTFRMEFSEEQVQVVSERYEASLAYPMLYRVYEDRHVFLIDLGAGECHFVPKRSLTKEDQQRLQEHFKRVMNEKYRQEGVR